MALTATAGILMVLTGLFHAIQGMVAIVDDEFFGLGEDYIFTFDVTAWGWIHLIGGIIGSAAAASLFAGPLWARTLAVVPACLSIIASFLWLPYYRCGASWSSRSTSS